MRYLDKKKNDIVNKMILFGYHNSRYIRIKSNSSIVNNFIRDKISELGSSEHYSELGLKGSPQHKGIKKIIYHCKEKSSIRITGHEIKSLFRTRKRNKKSEDVIFCTYSVYMVLQCLTDVLGEETLKKYFEFIPAFYSKISIHIQEMKRMEIELNKIYNKKNKIEKVISDLMQDI